MGLKMKELGSRHGYLFLLCGSEAEVVEDLRLQGAKGLQQGWDKSGSMRFQSGTGCLTNLHKCVDTSRVKKGRHIISN